MHHFKDICSREGEKLKLVYLLQYRKRGNNQETFIDKLITSKEAGVTKILSAVREKGVDGNVKDDLTMMLTKPADFIKGK